MSPEKKLELKAYQKEYQKKYREMKKAQGNLAKNPVLTLKKFTFFNNAYLYIILLVCFIYIIYINFIVFSMSNNI